MKHMIGTILDSRAQYLGVILIANYVIED